MAMEENRVFLDPDSGQDTEITAARAGSISTNRVLS